MSVATEPVGAAFGARVVGRSPADRSAHELTEPLEDHLRCSDAGDLDDAGQAALLAPPGRPSVHPLARVVGVTDAGAHRIVDVEHAPVHTVWHTDVTRDPLAPVIGRLRCVEMPGRGGDTMWPTWARPSTR